MPTASSVTASALTPRQEEILGAARDLLTRDGAEALTVARLAAALHIKAPSLYKHFSSKRDIEVLLIAEGLEHHAEAMEATGPGLADLAAAYRAFAVENPSRYRLMTARPLPREDLPEGLEARAAAPLVRAVGGDADLARAVWAYAHGMVDLELAGRFPADADLDAAWATAIAAFSAAAAAAAAPRGRASPGS
jgi:AcrR family transcriptional regulator